jgi:serine/threonine protein kinase
MRVDILAYPTYNLAKTMYEFLPIGYMLRGRYRILRVIGGGGMGAVYKSEDARNSGMHVAVKEMRTDIESHSARSPQAQTEEEHARQREEQRQLLEAFRREGQILMDLHHHNLPKVMDIFTEGGRPYLVMQLIPGESLEKKLDRLHGQPMSEEEALQYGIQMCEVLQFLHTQEPPVIFRDVKPANIMIMPNGQLKLIDFGIARTYKEGKRKDTMSMGTAAYAPFEQFGKGQTDARSDVYSLAATLYHLLTGRPPTPATTPANLHDFNPRINPKLESLIIRAMSRDMNTRPQTALILEHELRACLGKPYVAPVGDEQPTSIPSPLPSLASNATSQSGSSGIHPISPIKPLASSGYAKDSAAAAPNMSAASAPSSTSSTAVAIPTTPTQPGQGEDTQEPSQPLERVCMVCGATNQGKAHFCGRCGASLAGRPPGKIQVLGPNGVLWERRILENPFNIGRRSLSRQIFPHLDLTYNDPAAYVSRQHARILSDAGGYFLEDLGSANGTFLNDRRLPGGVPTRLRNGDRVRIGKVQCNFTLGG